MKRDLNDRPDFLWDEPLTRDDLKKLLKSENEEELLYYAAKILREPDSRKYGIISSRPFLPLTGKGFVGGWGEKKASGNFFIQHGAAMALSPKDILSRLPIPDFMIAPLSLEDHQEYFQSLARKLALESFPR